MAIGQIHKVGGGGYNEGSYPSSPTITSSTQAEASVKNITNAFDGKSNTFSTLFAKKNSASPSYGRDAKCSLICTFNVPSDKLIYAKQVKVKYMLVSGEYNETYFNKSGSGATLAINLLDKNDNVVANLTSNEGQAGIVYEETINLPSEVQVSKISINTAQTRISYECKFNVYDSVLTKWSEKTEI